MKLIFKQLSEEQIENAFQNKHRKLLSKEMSDFAQFVFDNRHKATGREEFAKELGIQDWTIPKLIARLTQCGFIFKRVGPRLQVKYQLIAVEDKPKATIKGMIKPKLNPIIESVFC